MASLLSSRHTRSPLSLQATEPVEDLRDPGPPGEPQGGGSWLLTAAAGAVATAVAGWVLAAGMAVVGWVTSEPGSLGEALAVGTQLWLLGNGGGTDVAGLRLTLVPWGYVAILAVLISRCAGYAARQVPSGTVRGGSTVLSAAVVMALAYLAPVMAVALLLGYPLAAVRAAAVMGPVVALAAAFGASRGLGYRVTHRWPAWSRSLPRAVVAAQLVLLAVGALAVVTATVQHLGRIERLVETLDAGFAGNLALLAVQLVYAPNFFVWAAGYALGGAFSVGTGSVVAATGTELGMLPAVPIFGALSEGALSQTAQWCWLAGGLVAGAVAALVVVLARPSAGVGEATAVGGVAGLLSGVVFTGLSWLSGGALGAERLAAVGPSLWPLLLLACGTIGLAAVAVGLALGLVRLARRAVKRRRKQRA